MHGLKIRAIGNINRKLVMRSHIPLIGIIALSGILTASCARQLEVVKLYGDNRDVVKVYQRLLVVDISSDRGRQKRFEDDIVNELQGARADGIAAHPTITFEDGVPREEITVYGEKMGVDGILLTSLVSIETSIDVEEGRTDIRSSCRGGNLVDYFLYDHEVIRAPDSVKPMYDAVVVSSLYDVATRERVWSIQSTCFDRSSMLDVLRSEARIIVQQLRLDELI